jgi:molecular chaperone DnaK
VSIPPAPRGIPQIEVTFDIDANGILNVTAKDRATNNEQKITITSSSGLSKEEVDKMAKDAEAHAADDRKEQEQIEARNRADNMVYSAEKTLKEHRTKISEAEAKEIETAIEETRKAIAEGDAAKLNAATDKLTTASHKLAEAYVQGRRPARRPQGRGAWRRPEKQQQRLRRPTRRTSSMPSLWMSTIKGEVTIQTPGSQHGPEDRLLRNPQGASRRFGRRDP